MRARYSVIIAGFLFLNTTCFAQWKSYYPENKLSKKEQKKTESENKKRQFKNYFFNAIKAKSLEDPGEALKYFEKCINLDLKISSPFYEASVINAENRNYTVAIEQIKEAIKLDPKNRWYLLLHAEILFNKQDFDNAALQYKKLISLEPGNEGLYFKLADTYIYANEFKKAIQVYNDLQNHKGGDKMLSMQKHKLYRELNDIKGAIRELNEIANVFPNDVEVMEILSELYLLNDEKEKAFELFKKISIINPNNGRIHLTLADYYRENQENEKSYEELKLAFKSTELNAETKIRILISYYQLIGLAKNMQDQANELAEILIKLHPESLKARAVFADILYTSKEYQKAKEQYLIVLEKDKSKSEVWSQVLFIQAEQMDFEAMIKTSKEALEYFPSNPLFYYFNGISNRWFENYDLAASSLEAGVEFVVDNQKLLLELYSLLADIYYTKSDYKKSDQYYEKVLEMDPDNLLALNNYAYYLSLRKTDLEKAKEMSFRCNELEPDNGTYQDTYGWILYQLEEYGLAKKWLLKALSNGSINSPVVVEHYGDVLYRLGETKLAIEQWKKAKELGGGSNLLNKKIQERELYE